MMQTLAIFRDSYRQLAAGRMFWIVLGISGLVVLSFGLVGLTPEGLKIAFWEVPSPFNSQTFPPETFYKLMFANLGVQFWLAWLTSILALISTAGIIPEFISGGAIELTLSKPIGRFRLFVTKYLSGLLFVTLQVGVFTLACFLVIGLRGKAWEPGLFWAIPYTVLFFSYLYAVCALLGLVTRSTIAALLLTLLFWLAIFGVHSAEQLLLYFRERSAMKVDVVAAQVERLDASDPGSPAYTARSEKLAELRNDHAELARWHRRVYLGKTIVPKTAETVQLLERKLMSEADLEIIHKDAPNQGFGRNDVPIDERALNLRLEKLIRSRSPTWVIGTSLLFEAAVVGLAGLIFSRRDF